MLPNRLKRYSVTFLGAYSLCLFYMSQSESEGVTREADNMSLTMGRGTGLASGGWNLSLSKA